jgi:hypothetical protein
MTVVVVNLKDKPLRATSCGGCQGSSSDALVRPERETKAQARREAPEGGRVAVSRDPES